MGSSCSSRSNTTSRGSLEDRHDATLYGSFRRRRAARSVKLGLCRPRHGWSSDRCGVLSDEGAVCRPEMIARGGMKAIVMIAFALSVTATAHAQGRTDVVTLANGDRITGEIGRLERGRLEFKTDDAGTLYLEWDKISRLVATRQVEVLTTDGRRFLGSLGQAQERSIAVVTSDGRGVAPDVGGDVDHSDRNGPLEATRWVDRRRVQLYAVQRCFAAQSEFGHRLPPARVPGTAHRIAHPDKERR